jgi:hypothetical protein
MTTFFDPMSSESAAGTRSAIAVVVQPVETRLLEADLKLQQALARFDRARSWEEYQPAQESVLSLGREVAPGVLAELAKPQSPERFDVLLRLLLKWKTAEEVLEIVAAPNAGWILRAALAESLRYYADAGDARTRERIAVALVRLARDEHDGVRVVAVEAIGLAGLSNDPDVARVLADAADHDPNPDVQDEAREILSKSS